MISFFVILESPGVVLGTPTPHKENVADRFIPVRSACQYNLGHYKVCIFEKSVLSMILI